MGNPMASTDALERFAREHPNLLRLLLAASLKPYGELN